jgi:hypothetical protein
MENILTLEKRRDNEEGGMLHNEENPDIPSSQDTSNLERSN